MTGVQTCALPICRSFAVRLSGTGFPSFSAPQHRFSDFLDHHAQMESRLRSPMLLSDLLETDQAIHTVSFTGEAASSRRTDQGINI